MELEKFKSYFMSVVKKDKDAGAQSAMLTNLLMNSNTKEYNLSQERVMQQQQMNHTHRSPHVSNNSLMNNSASQLHNNEGKNGGRRGNSTVIENYPELGTTGMLRNQKKVVYQVQQRTSNPMLETNT